MWIKNILFVLIISSTVGCSEARVVEEVQKIEGCDYIVSRNSYSNSLTHKGNCSSSIHDCKCNK